MLFNKHNLKILQDLDERAATSDRTSKFSPKDTSKIPEIKNGGLLKTSRENHGKGTSSLQQEICKLRGEKISLLMKLKIKDQELEKVKEEKNSQYRYLLETKTAVDNFTEEIQMFENKLNQTERAHYWKNLAKAASKQKIELKREIQNLQNSLDKEIMMNRVLQDDIVTRFSKELNLTRGNRANYDDLKKHTELQKFLRKKVDELNKKESQILEKDKMLEILKNSKARMHDIEQLKQSAEISKKIREKETEIRILIAQVNMCESAIAGYKNEVNNLKQILTKHKLDMKQK